MQLSAALYSLLLLRHFGGRLVWLALAGALFLMTIRRSLSLYQALDADPLVIKSLETELVALLISALVLLAVLSFRPLIETVIEAEKKLSEEKQRNNIILESSPDGVCIINSFGIIEEINPAYCKMLEMDEALLLGKNFNHLTASISPHKSQDIINKIMLEEHGRYDLIQSNTSGNPVYLELIGRHVVSPEHDFIYLFLRDITERKNAEKALNQIKNTLDQTLDSVFMFSPITLQFTYVNEGAIKHLGFQRDVLLTMTPVDIKPGFSDSDFRNLIAPLVTGKQQVLSFETIHENAKRKRIPVEVFLQYVHVENNEPAFVAIVRDITDRTEAQAKLKEQKERALVTLASIGDGVITTNMVGVIDYMNKVAEDLCGLSLIDARGKLLPEVCCLRDEQTGNTIDDPVIKSLLKNGPLFLNNNLELISADNQHYSVEVVVSPIFDDENFVMGTVLVLHDTTELRGMAQQLSYQATHDSLTGLINRREFENRLNESLTTVKREDTEYVLFYMDLDQFKIINDTCGHLAGDDLLLKVTHLFGNCMRESDTLARLGGDEFGVLLENCHVKKAREIADKIHYELTAFRFCWEKYIFEVGVSIGIVTINKSVINITDLLSAADSACYVAKERGRNSQHLYIDGDKALARRHGDMQWYQRIQHAFEDSQFEIYMQQIKPTNANNPSHAEILLRLVSDDAMISPKQFLPTAERYHLACDIDRWVLRKVFSVMNCNKHRLVSLGGICAINLSGQSIGNEGFLKYVVGLFNEYQVDGRLICFEITETAVISNISLVRKFISEMKSRGCQFSLDDFGSGLSSFTYLKNLDVDYIKIDGSFVINILQDQADYTMVSTINHLGHSLGIKTIAEFAETPELVSELEIIGLDYIQGYAIDVPSPVLLA
jgi:diguanylate cyclase (GGDEF)-like protein/PAS domain S-box-containing protein